MLKRTVLITAAVAVVTFTLGTGPAPAQGNQAGLGDADRRLLEAEAAAGQAASATTGNGRALQAVQDSIARWVERNGPRHTFASFTDPDTGRVVVETDAPTGLVRALTSVGGPAVEVRQATTNDTVGDTAPFWGGIGLKAAGASCTAGFTVKKPSNVRYLATAAHCFGLGAGVLAAATNAVVGTVVQKGPATMDAALIGNKTYDPRVKVGIVGLPVVAAADPVVNFTGYCHTGWTTGQQCGHKVVSTTAQVCTPSGCKSPLVRFQATTGSLPQAADSGGPFYLKSGSNVHVRGIVIASGGGSGYAEKWSRISSQLGVSIVTV